ncbi:hypothetical protein [Pedobacter lusitanus]|nr:hypothetical protein [Pedobacter lusitanus]
MDNCKSNKRQWYAFTHGDPLIAENYFRTNVQPAFEIGERICAVYTKDNGIHPRGFTNEMKSIIADALVTGIPQPTNAVPLVLLKP